MTIPNPEMRDIGPYESTEQVVRQFRNWRVGLPFGDSEAAGLLLIEAAMVTNAAPSQFEQQYLSELAGSGNLDPVLATIIHGWLIRVKTEIANEVEAFQRSLNAQENDRTKPD